MKAEVLSAAAEAAGVGTKKTYAQSKREGDCIRSAEGRLIGSPNARGFFVTPQERSDLCPLERMNQEQKIDYSKIYSPHKLGMFEKCPKEYHFTYLDPVYSKLKNSLKKMPENIWDFQTLGKAVHNAITLFYHLSPKERTEANLLEKLKETWRSEVMWNKKPPLGRWGGFDDNDVESERNAYRRAIRMLRNFLKMADADPKIKVLPIENLRESIEDYKFLITRLTDEVDISGKFDLVAELDDGTLQVIDYKTAKRDNFDPFQLRFYKALAELRFGESVGQVSLHFLESGEIRNIDLQNESTEDIKKEILKKVEAIQSTKKFEPNPTKLCRYCLFKTFCPAREEVNAILKDSPGQTETPSDLPF